MSEENMQQDDPIKQAMFQRDSALAETERLKKQLADMQSRVLSDDDRALFDTLRDQQAKTEEDRKKKAGEWDVLRNQLSEKHAEALRERDDKLSALSTRFKDTVVRAEFGAATDYFGGAESSKTILDVDLGMAALGKYVSVEDTDDEIGYRIVVKKPNGQTVFGADGNPAPFAQAMGELINALPNKDRILRGSGKTGSGSSGGSTGSTQPVDLRHLTAARLRDPKVIAALREQIGDGSMQMGTAFQKRG